MTRTTLLTFAIRGGAALAAAAGLLAGLAGIARPAAAAELGTPNLIEVSFDAGASPAGYVRFRDNSAREHVYQIYWWSPEHPQRSGMVDATPVPGEGRVATRTVSDRLLPNTRYCFYLLAWGDNFTSSNYSNEICRTTPPVPAPAPAPNPAPAPAPAPEPAPKPVNPSLRVTRVTRLSDRQLFDGMTETFEVVIANLGARPKEAVGLDISTNEILDLEEMTQIDSRYTCDGTFTFSCTGMLGGDGDPLGQTVAIFRVKVRATGTGTGYLYTSVDPQNQSKDPHRTGQTMNATATVR